MIICEHDKNKKILIVKVKIKFYYRIYDNKISVKNSLIYFDDLANFHSKEWIFLQSNIEQTLITSIENL